MTKDFDKIVEWILNETEKILHENRYASEVSIKINMSSFGLPTLDVEACGRIPSVQIKEKTE